MKNLLKNKIVLTLFVIVAAVGVLAITQIGSNTSGGGRTVKSDNPLYSKLDRQIDEYEASEKWSVNDYSSLKHRIEIASSLNRQEKKQLKKTLAGKHVNLLHDTLSEFIKTVEKPSRRKIEYIKKDVDKLAVGYEEKTIELKERLDQYYKLNHFYWGANGYTEKKKFVQSTTDYYKNGLEEYYSYDFYMDNTVLLENIQSMIDDKLIMHQNVAGRFDSDVEKPSCNCKQFFGGFNYYVDACKVFQLVKWDISYYIGTEYDESETTKFMEKLEALKNSEYLKGDKKYQDIISENEQKLLEHKEEALRRQEEIDQNNYE